MLRKYLIVPFALAATFVTAVPASAVDLDLDELMVAIEPCQSVFSTRLTEYYETHHVAGAATVKGAIDVRLTCGLVRWGETVATISEDAPGPAAVVADSVTIMGGLHDVCYVVEAWDADGAYSVDDRCP